MAGFELSRSTHVAAEVAPVEGRPRIAVAGEAVYADPALGW